MLRIRLRRTGRKNRPHYRIVVAEHSAPLTGKFVDQLGHFDPRTKAMGLDQDRLTKWLGVGAQPSNRVAKLLTTAGGRHKLIVVKQRAARAPKKADEAAPASAAKQVATEAVPAATDASTPEAADVDTAAAESEAVAAVAEPATETNADQAPTN